MNSIWASLLWKEWREHRLIIAVLGAAAVLVPMAFSLRNLSNIVPAVTFCLFTIPAISMFIGMNIAGREQSAGTIRFLQSLPITGRRPATAKLLWASISITIPVLLMVGTAALWIQMLPESAASEAINADQGIYGGKGGAGAWYVIRVLAAIASGVSILIWMTACGVNRTDEVRAGAIGFLVMSGYWALLTLFAYLADMKGPEPAMRVLMATAPAGIVASSNTNLQGGLAVEFWSRNWFVLAAAAISHGALLAWYIGSYGRIVPGRPQTVEREAPVTTVAWLAPPWRRPLTAILWKQIRESAPLPLLASGCILAIAFIAGWAVPRYDAAASAFDVMEVTYALWMMVGCMVATVAGVGIFMEDLRPGLHTFWRSRPINVDQWFVVKFVVGLLSTIVTLAIPLLLAAAYVSLTTDRAELSRLLESGEARQMIVMGLFTQVSFYTAAVAAMVVVRQPIYAVVIAIAGVGLSVALGGWLLETLHRQVFWHRHEITTLVAFALFLFAMLAATAFAWVALRRDWGWKR